MMRMVQKKVLDNFCLKGFLLKNFSTRMHLPQGLTPTCFLKNCNLTKGLAMQRSKFCFVGNKEVLTTACNHGSLNVNFSGLP